MQAANGLSGATVWFTLALINAGLAESKHRSRLAWFLLSLLLGPIATLLIVALAPPAQITPSSSYTPIDPDN